MLICPHLKKLSSITHGFFTRKGGVSTGIYTSLNCGPGSQDIPENVQNNRYRVLEKLGTEQATLCTLHQLHSADVAIVDTSWNINAPPQADALVTTLPNMALGILTADCAPVLLTDPKARVIAAAHAGWKGAKAGILENTIETMEQLGAKIFRIAVTIGPCISPESYEVSKTFREEFPPEDEDFFHPAQRNNHLMFNLPGYVKHRLEKRGIGNIHILNRDTLTNEEHFFSYRRATLRGESDYGRQISVICLGDKS